MDKATFMEACKPRILLLSGDSVPPGLFCRALTGAERMAFVERFSADGAAFMAEQARFVSRHVCSETGEPLASESDVAALDAGIVDAVFTAILEANGMGRKAVEVARGN
jgi:hypothetical protein